MYVINEGLVHLIDEFYWYMGFKNAEQAEKVTCVDTLGVVVIFVMISILSQVRNDMGIPEYVWREKREALAKEIDDLGEEFRPKFKSAWLDYLKTMHAGGASAPPPTINSSSFVVDDED